MKISVVIPFFRREQVIRETLESVFNQTYQPFEIIVVDDASGEESLHHLMQYIPRIKLISSPRNGGVSNARNTGVAVAQGDYVAFLDSDDLWAPDKLEKQVEHLQAHRDCQIVHCGCVNFYPDGSEKSFVDKPVRLSLEHMVKGSHVMFSSVIMQRALYLKSKGFNPRFRQTEDYEYSFRLIKAGYNVDFIPLPLVRMRHGRADKLSLNWKGFITGHIKVVLQNKEIFIALSGYKGLYQCLVKYLRSGSYKAPSTAGITVRALSFLLYPFKLPGGQA
jgi:glycosyltransferase involved in cell wall biosynthesis